jgi:hypothetical protein
LDDEYRLYILNLFIPVRIILYNIY